MQKFNRLPRKALLPLVAVTAAFGLFVSGCGARVGEESAAPSQLVKSCVNTSGSKIKVGFLNSLSGTMAVSEKTVRDSLDMAAAEINASGGVLGKQLDIVGADGASDPNTFAQKADQLIRSDCVAAVFGGWTSASRKAMKPVFEKDNGLLYYPVQYEGMEDSPNIYYLGAAPNQQIVPALDWMKSKGYKRLFLVGSDYVFPRTANKIIQAYAKSHDMQVVDEQYVPLGATDFTTIANKLKNSGADAVFNTLNGDSNVAFFRQFASMGLNPQNMPTVSVSIAEEEIPGIGLNNIEGQYTAWNYYQTLDIPENKTFVADFKKRYGQNRVTSDPMEAAYSSLYLWKLAVEKAGSFDVNKVRDASGGISFNAPEGKMTIDGENHHVYKTPRVGQINSNSLIDTIWQTDAPIKPDPYLKGYSWAQGLS
ncbi:urea ABC transporter substrate-binding protein [Propionibacterium sp.]|uniref:urea ABC transporter substrate-binding protein n=1 Tax=Propionibacterium sp. TaxID=1977903 RepID=UPI0039E9F4D0